MLFEQKHTALLRVAKSARRALDALYSYMNVSAGKLWASNGYSMYRMDIAAEGETGLVKTESIPPKINAPIDIPLDDCPPDYYPDVEQFWEMKDKAHNHINFFAREILLLARLLTDLKIKGDDTVRFRWESEESPVFIETGTDFDGVIMPQKV